MNKTVTMSDIAKDMGISTVSVSKAISGKDGVSDELREKIIRRAEELGYQYSKNKVSQTSDSKTIGVLVADKFINDETFYSKIYQIIVMELTKVDSYGMMEIIPSKSVKKGIPPIVLQNDKVDGLILLGHLPVEYITQIQEYHLPIVCLDFYDDHIKADSVISDNIYGACQITRYLIDHGHTKIGFIGSYHQTSSIMDRYIGYYKAMVQADLSICKEWILEDRDADGKYIDIVFPDDMPTAFVCNCDDVAFIVIKKLKRMGYRIPEDISIVGFDNSIHAELCSPKITTFDVNVDGMVKNAVDIILRKVDNPEYTVGRVIVTGNMVERKSARAV